MMMIKAKFIEEPEAEDEYEVKGRSNFNFGGFEETSGADSQESAGENQEEEPSLREFTLIISRLLFHLSQMQ